MRKLFLPIIAVLSLVSIVMLKVGFIFIVLAMLPSFIAYFSDKTSSKSLFKTVAACNFTAIIPAIASMISASINGKTYDLIGLITQPFVWIFIYLCAVAGWGLGFLCKIATRYVVIMVYDYRIAILERAQTRLLEEWGMKITEKELE